MKDKLYTGLIPGLLAPFLVIALFYLFYNRENETYNFLKRNVQFSLFFHPIKAKAFNHHLSGN